MKILLDIDDTSMLLDKKKLSYYEHPRLHELISKHTIILFSGNPDIEYYYKKWGTAGYIPKGTMNLGVASDSTEDELYNDNEAPDFSDYGITKSVEADVLIDDDADRWSKEVIVKKKYKSINAFFKKNP